MGVYRVLRSFICDGYSAAVGQYIDADDEWALSRLNAGLDPEVERESIIFVKKVHPRQVPEGTKVVRLGPEGKALSRTKPVREGTEGVQTKPVTPER